LTNATGLAVSVQKGSFGVVKTANIASLNVTDGGILAVTLDKTPAHRACSMSAARQVLLPDPSCSSMLPMSPRRKDISS
jgi:hypothetical protein